MKINFIFVILVFISFTGGHHSQIVKEMCHCLVVEEMLKANVRVSRSIVVSDLYEMGTGNSKMP